jgi:RNA polymerase sigma factor (sigma-70 family)
MRETPTGVLRSAARDSAAAGPAEGLDARFRRPLMKFFMRRVRHFSEAEDLTQEVFVRALGSGELARVQRADSFLFTVATNLLRDRHRAAARRAAAARGTPAAGCEAAALRPGEASGETLGPVEDRGPERVLQGYESLAEVLASLDTLGARTRDIFILFRLESMKQREIADLYGMTQKAVEKHVLKAVMHLARLYGGSPP